MAEPLYTVEEMQTDGWKAPFQECDDVKYNKFMGYLREIDLTEIVEMEDNTNLQGELACAGGVCEI